MTAQSNDMVEACCGADVERSVLVRKRQRGSKDNSIGKAPESFECELDESKQAAGPERLESVGVLSESLSVSVET